MSLSMNSARTCPWIHSPDPLSYSLLLRRYSRQGWPSNWQPSRQTPGSSETPSTFEVQMSLMKSPCPPSACDHPIWPANLTPKGHYLKLDQNVHSGRPSSPQQESSWWNQVPNQDQPHRQSHIHPTGPTTSRHLSLAHCSMSARQQAPLPAHSCGC